MQLLLLGAALPSATGQVAAWDCTTYPLPVQILKATGESDYKTMQLNLAAGTYEEIWRWTSNTNSHPTASINAQAYNVNDGIVYGLFSASSSGAPTQTSYLCRFSHVQDSMVCLCEAPFWGFTATITRDGTYYLAKTGGTEIHKLPAVQDIAYPSGSPVPVSTLSSCGMTKIMQGKGTGGAVDVSSASLSVSALEAAYDLPSTCSSCYMSQWTKIGSNMATWAPGNQNFADFIDFEHNSITYLIALGGYDGSVYIGKLDGDGGGDMVGYAYSRVTVDYTGSTSNLRTMAGFGAG